MQVEPLKLWDSAVTVPKVKMSCCSSLMNRWHTCWHSYSFAHVATHTNKHACLHMFTLCLLIFIFCFFFPFMFISLYQTHTLSCIFTLSGCHHLWYLNLIYLIFTRNTVGNTTYNLQTLCTPLYLCQHPNMFTVTMLKCWCLPVIIFTMIFVEI